jgi:L,D-transpeptidase catalytic domain
MLYSLIITAGMMGSFTDSSISKPSNNFLNGKIIEAKIYCKQKGYDTTVCFLLDLSIHNGRKRFFVCDMTRNTITKSGLVTHGSCNTRYLSEVAYSNKPGCGCSSEGKYRIGGLYKGIFGDAFKLYGLEITNSNVYERFIVLHSHSCVPDAEIYPNQICNSQGCTTVSPAFLKELKTIIQDKKKPILLWVVVPQH